MQNIATMNAPAPDGRLPWHALAPEPTALLRKMEDYFRDCGLEMSLIELVKTRASQLNGCGYCIDMHTKDARLAGESEQRLYALSAWREAPFYSARERAALAWTEAVTDISHGHAPQETYDAVKHHFGEKELADLTWVISAINAWNRMAISLRTPVGSYQPGED